MSFLTKVGVIKLLESQFLNCSQFRHYTRWSHRRPKRILTPEQYTEIESKYQKIDQNNVETVNKNSKPQVLEETHLDALKVHDNINDKLGKSSWAPKNNATQKQDQLVVDFGELDEKSDTPTSKIDWQFKKKKNVKYLTKADAKPTDMLETIIDADGNIVYTKLPEKDATLSKVLISVKSHNERIKKDLALLEGKRLIKEALEANCKLESLIFSRKSDIEYLKPFLPKTGAKLYKIPYREIQMWSDLSTTPGLMGIFKTPQVEKISPPEDSLDITVICDNVREPGNLGAILRTAVGVGVQNVFLTKGCVDLWDTKVLRSACGAHFHVQIHKKMDWFNIKAKLQDLKGTILIADNKITTDTIINDTSEDLEDCISRLPILPYYSPNYGELGTLVIIIGGETEGISGDSYRFAAESSGLRLNIPLSKHVDSLNTGTSLGIILFEIKRQLALVKYKHKLQIESC